MVYLRTFIQCPEGPGLVCVHVNNRGLVWHSVYSGLNDVYQRRIILQPSINPAETHYTGQMSKRLTNAASRTVSSAPARHARIQSFLPTSACFQLLTATPQLRQQALEMTASSQVNFLVAISYASRYRVGRDPLPSRGPGRCVSLSTHVIYLSMRVVWKSIAVLLSQVFPPLPRHSCSSCPPPPALAHGISLEF